MSNTGCPKDHSDLRESPRAELLDGAKHLITQDRNNQYGPPTQDFQRSADAMNAYGYRGPDGKLIQPHDIAILVMLVKISRLMWSPEKRDHWEDLAGYSGCGYECTVNEEPEEEEDELLDINWPKIKEYTLQEWRDKNEFHQWQE